MRADCLTKAQVSAVRAIYDGANNPRTGEQLYPGWVRGSEAGGGEAGGWSGYFVGQPEPATSGLLALLGVPRSQLGFPQLRLRPGRRLRRLQDVVRHRQRSGPHPLQTARRQAPDVPGLGRPVVPPDGHHPLLRERASGPWAARRRRPAMSRLFLAPGMGHCSGGPGPSAFDALSALDRVGDAKGRRPIGIIATHSTDGTVDRTRPLCPYPQVARWKGSGSTDNAAAFRVRARIHASDRC